MFQAAIDRRAAMAVAPLTNVRRLVDGEGDGLPGVVLDRYGPVARLELWAERWPDALGDDADIGDESDDDDDDDDDDGKDDGDDPLMLRAMLAPLGVRAAVATLRTAAGRSSLRRLFGEVPDAHVVSEAGMRLLVRTADAKAVGAGVFVDQREGRAIVRAEARGKVTVNLFAHAGAYGVAAAVGGAGRVDHVDMAKKCAPWAAANLAINGIDPRGHRFIVDDALQVLHKLARKGGADIVVCDPPTQAVRRDGTRFVLRHSLEELAHDAACALHPGGLLVLSCNDRDVAVADVMAACARGAAAAGRVVKALDPLPLPADITSAQAVKGRPMRGALLRLV